MRGFGLGKSIERLLIAVALFKIQRFLNDGLRLRTACDLELNGDGNALVVTRPQGFALPTLAEIEAELPELIKGAEERLQRACADHCQIRGISDAGHRFVFSSEPIARDTLGTACQRRRC